MLCPPDDAAHDGALGLGEPIPAIMRHSRRPGLCRFLYSWYALYCLFFSLSDPTKQKLRLARPSPASFFPQAPTLSHQPSTSSAHSAPSSRTVIAPRRRSRCACLRHLLPTLTRSSQDSTFPRPTLPRTRTRSRPPPPTRYTASHPPPVDSSMALSHPHASPVP